MQKIKIEEVEEEAVDESEECLKQRLKEVDMRLKNASENFLQKKRGSSFSMLMQGPTYNCSG